MIDIDMLKKAALVQDPFRYSIIEGILTENRVNSLLESMPEKNYYRSIREGGSDKTYNVVNNILLKLGEREYNKDSNLSVEWQALVQNLQGKDYIEALSSLLQENLSTCSQEITLKRYTEGDFISAHTDKENVRATHMLFLNKNWDKQWGGELCFLHNETDVFKNILPVYTCSAAFVRADNSWHSVTKMEGKNIERIAIQIAFWNVTERQVLPGRVEENY